MHYPLHFKDVSICCCLVDKLCQTLFDRMNYSIPGFSVLHYLPELAQIHVHWHMNLRAGKENQPTCKNSQLTRRPMVLNSGFSTCWILYSWEIIFFFYLIYQMSFFCTKTLAQICSVLYFILSVPTWHFQGHKRLDILLSLIEINILILPFSDKSTVTSDSLSIVVKWISISIKLV